MPHRLRARQLGPKGCWPDAAHGETGGNCAPQGMLLALREYRRCGYWSANEFVIAVRPEILPVC
jgi:hypothetical protein